MLTLNDGRAELWQWDTGRTLTVDADCSQVHFSNKVFGRSIDVDVVDGTAIVPDILLQTERDLNVWAFVGTAENGYTKISKTFKVNRRNKPADYVFTPTDQMTLQTIQRQIGDLADLTTTARDNLVAAINEAAKSGGGGGGTAADVRMQVADGYIQYSTDGGTTWRNLIAMKDLIGKEGIGIQSVEQTTTSTEDGGTNVVTVKKTDGTTSTFSVKNGSKGNIGKTPNIQIGTVETLESGSNATASISGTAEAPLLNLGIPKGETGGSSGGGAGIVIDSTLTQSGQAADAAVVGNRLSALSEEIANLQTSGLTTEQINALDGMFKVCAFTKADVSAEYTAFKTAFGIADSGDGGETEVTLTSISATYDGGDVAVGTAVADLTGLVVTAHYSDGTSQTVTGYTLSGTIAEGSNTVTVTYQGKTATFTVTGVAESGGGDEPVDTTAKIAGTGYGLNSQGELQSREKACYTEFYSFGRTIEGRDSRKVIYYVSTGNQGGMAGADKQTVYQDGEFVTYWTTRFDSVNENNFGGNYGPFNQLRFSLVTAYIDDDYAYFADTGEVIFAGKNTQYYGMANIDGTMAVKV